MLNESDISMFSINVFIEIFSGKEIIVLNKEFQFPSDYKILHLVL